jgi:hypothetical protein
VLFLTNFISQFMSVVMVCLLMYSKLTSLAWDDLFFLFTMKGG